jgi:tRNA modification GTPase
VRGGDTIVALASGAGKAGVAVLRLSGPAVRFALETAAGGIPPPRRAVLRTISSPDGEAIDTGLVLFFPQPSSFTGEDVAEFHLHGGRAVVEAALRALTSLGGIRVAERGEFTRRAVENGRLDLTEAEGLLDLVEAETAAQRRQALRQSQGSLLRPADDWRNRLVGLLALAEAEIDFPDEGDVPSLLGRIRQEAETLRDEVDAVVAGARHGERLREGARIVIAGAPNVGKSTLLNALARRDVAIVSPIPGTTRDRLEVFLDLEGYPATVIDTAGLRETVDPVERLGIDRTKAALAEADLVLWLHDGNNFPPPPETEAPVLTVRTKADLPTSGKKEIGALCVSAVSGSGMADLLDRLAEGARRALEEGETAIVTRARHRTELAAVADHLGRVATSGGSAPIEFIAEDLRLALRGMGRLTGRVDIDEIYDRIFREFCIGK